MNANLKRFNNTITSIKTKDYLSKVIGNKSSSFINNITALVANNKNLQDCEPYSILYAGIKATALDLPLDNNLGMAYVIPYKNVAQFQIGYKGFQQLALRSGCFSRINTVDVREGEIIRRDFLTGEIIFKWEQDEEKRKKLKIIGYVNYFKLVNGFESILYKTVGELQAHGKEYSKTYSKETSKWQTDFDSMARKTVIKLNLSHNAPLSVELQTAIKSDQAVIQEDGSYDYIDANELEVKTDETEENEEAEKQKKVQEKFQGFEKICE